MTNNIIIETRKCKKALYAWGLASTCLAITAFISVVILSSLIYSLLFLFFFLFALYWVIILVVPIYRIPYRFDISENTIAVHYTSLTGESYKCYSKSLFCLCYSYDKKVFGIQIKTINRSLLPFLYYGNLLDKNQWSNEQFDKLIAALIEYGFDIKKQRKLKG